MFNKRFAAAVAGATLVPFALLAPNASAEGTAEIIQVDDKCYTEKTVSKEEVVGSRTVAETGHRDGEWQVGDIKGPEGWTFLHDADNQPRGVITAEIPAGTPAGEYQAQAFHFGYSKNQVSETVTFNVVEQDVTETRTWTEREETPCHNESSDKRDGGDSHEGGLESQVLANEQSNFTDFKVLAQQQALNAPAAPAAAAAAPATAEAVPAETTQAAQQQQLANTGISGALTILAVSLLAAAGGAALILKRRAA